jgi:hypothetical protein
MSSKVASQLSTYITIMAKPDYTRDKNDLPLYTDNVGTERLVVIAGNILDSANNVYNYDSVNETFLMS